MKSRIQKLEKQMPTIEKMEPITIPFVRKPGNELTPQQIMATKKHRGEIKILFDPFR